MTQTPDPDEGLLAELAEALGPDPMPPGLLGRAEGLLAFAGFDRELAALLDETAAGLPVGVRGPAGDPGGGSGPAGEPGPGGGARIVFEVADGSVMLEVTLLPGPGGEQVSGQVLAGNPAELVLERLDGGTFRVPVDALGRFSFAATTGLVRLRLDEPPAGPGGGERISRARPVTTDWFLLGDGT